MIGRANDSTLVLTDDYACTRHARLVSRDGDWYVEDLGSTNGTYLDRTKVTGPTLIPAGVPIRIGKTVLELSMNVPGHRRQVEPVTLPCGTRSAPTAASCAPTTRTRSTPGPRLLALADGMGGHAAGEVASNVAIATLAPWTRTARSTTCIGPCAHATEAANNHLRDDGRAGPQPRRHGHHADRAAVRRLAGSAWCTSATPARYLLRGGQLHPDHPRRHLRAGAGRRGPAHRARRPAHHPQRSLILHALNGADVEPDLSIREARIGDRYLLCSDGLSDVVSPETLLEALQLPDPHESADRLVELALRGGGPDNVTCIVADVIDVPVRRRRRR